MTIMMMIESGTFFNSLIPPGENREKNRKENMAFKSFFGLHLAKMLKNFYNGGIIIKI